jgi:hypothetical protein
MNSSSNTKTSKRTNIEQDQNPGLVTPTVPAAIYDEDHEGLLPIAMLNKPLRVEFAGWLAIRPGHTCQLLWDDTLIGEIKTITTENHGDPLFLEVPADLLVEGVHRIAYRATNTYNGVSADSTAVRLEIVQTPPGLPQLAPMKFPELVECGLTSLELADLGDQLIAEIGSYANVYQLDEIRTFWGDIEGPGTVVRKTASGIDRIMVTYTKEFLLSLGSFNGLVTYTVQDRAGNISTPSMGTHIQLLLNDQRECTQSLDFENSANSTHHVNNILDITLRLQSSQGIQPK